VVPAALVGHLAANLVGGSAAAAFQWVNLVQQQQLSAAAVGVSSGGITSLSCNEDIFKHNNTNSSSSSKQHRDYLSWVSRRQELDG